MLILKAEEVRALEGLLIELALTVIVCPPNNPDVNRFVTFSVLGADIVQVGVAETFTPDALTHDPTELTSVNSAGNITSSYAVTSSLLTVVNVKV